MIILDDTWMPHITTFSQGYVRYHRFGDENFFYPTDHHGVREKRTVHFYIKHNRRNVLSMRGIKPLEGILVITDYEN